MPNYKNLPANLKKYVPDFEYMLADLSHLEQDQNIDLQEDHSIVVRTLNKVRYATKDEVMDLFIEAITLFTKTKDRDMVDHYITETLIYILGVRQDLDEKELAEIAGQISEEGGDLVMSVAERLRQEGIKKGEIKNMRKAIIGILFNRFNNTDVSVNKNLDVIDDIILLDNLFNKAFQVQSLEEFRAITDNIVI